MTVRELGHSVRDLQPIVNAADADGCAAFKARLGTPLAPAVAADLPDWLWTRLGDAYGDDERALLARAWLAAASLDLRVNPLKTTRDDARAALAASGIDATPTPWSPLGLRVDGRPALGRHSLVTSGALEVQDEGSQLVGYLVAPRRTDMVVDFCAGAGGKTLLLGALMRSQGTALRLRRRRAAPREPEAASRALGALQRASAAHRERARREDQASRAARSTACWSTRRARASARCAAIPTSSGGSRKPRSRSLRASSDAILAAAATLVKPGGRLVYVTISFRSFACPANSGAVNSNLPGSAQNNLDAIERAVGKASASLDRFSVTPVIPVSQTSPTRSTWSSVKH